MGSLAGVGAGLGAAGSLLGGYSANQSAKASAKLAREQGDQAEINAIQQAKSIRKAAKSQIGSARAVAAANGADVNSGPAVDITSDMMNDSEYDAAMSILTGTRAKRAAYNQAAIARSQGSNALLSGGIGAAGSLLSGGSKAGWW